MFRAVETLTTGRTPGRLASPTAGMGSSGSSVVTGGGGGDDGGPDGSTSGDSLRDRRSRRRRRSHRRRRPRSSSSDSSSRSDKETVRRTLEDVQILVHKVGDNLLNTVTDWHSYRLDNQNQTFTSRKRLRITKDQKKLRISMDRVALTGLSRSNSSAFCAGLSGHATRAFPWREKRSTWSAPSLPGQAPLGSTRSSLTRPGTSRAGLSHASRRRCTGSWSIKRTPSTGTKPCQT